MPLNRQLLYSAQRASLACAVLALAACGDGDGAGAPVPVPSPPPPPVVVFPPAPATGRVSGVAAFAAGCDGQGGVDTLYAEAEVEPHVAVHPQDPQRLIAAWQQNRWSGGSAQGLLGAVSTDGGTTWTRISAPFSRCTGGTAANGGDYARATDPWVAVAPDGTLHMMSLSTLGGGFAAGSANAMLASRSTDGGLTWSDPATLIRDGQSAFNDKNTLTADPTSASFVYAVWDRITTQSTGPTWFARSTNGGVSWEAARSIHDPGTNNQTIGNLIVVIPGGPLAGTLINVFTQIDGSGSSATLRVQRSTDRGVNWSAPITVAPLRAIGARDPQSNLAVRDGAGIAQAAAAPNGDLYVVWQDASFSGGQVDAIAIARSIDGGVTWSAPARVSPQQQAAAFTPQVAVRADGAVAVTYFDLRSDTLDPTTLATEKWLAVSTDGGATWREQRVADPFDLTMAPIAGGYFLGDYQGLVASGAAFVPVYVQTTGAAAANRTDVFAQRIVPVTTATGTVRAAGRFAEAGSTADAGFDGRVRAMLQRLLARRAGRRPR